jgi:hypothetical protein
MSVAIADDATINDIDEALRHLSLVPDTERGNAWHAYSDALLERRAQILGDPNA